MGFLIFVLCIVLLLVVPAILACAAYENWREKRKESGKKVSKEISPFWISHIIVASIAGMILVLSIYNVVRNQDNITWNDLWGSLGGTLICFLFASFLHILYRGQDPEIEAGRYKIRGRYILGGPKSWELTIKYSPIYLFVLAGTFLAVSLATLIVLLVK